MQKLFTIITFSKAMRSHIVNLHELLSCATDLRHVIEVNRRARYYQERIETRMQEEKGFLLKVELRSVKREMMRLRNRIGSMTAMFLSEAA